MYLESISFYGFDMDYTIAEYNSPEYETLIFDLTKNYMVLQGYPLDILKFQYDPSFPIRGIWFDTIYGNLLKVNEYGNILMCVHGFDFYNHDQISKLYPNEFIQYDVERIYVSNTLYHLPEMYLLACLIDYFSNSPEYTKEGSIGVRVGHRYISFKSIYQDETTANNSVHYKELKTKTLENIDLYLKKNVIIPLLFSNISKTGKKVFLLTNSDYKYTNAIMTYLFDFPHGATPNEPHRDWKTYFDIIIVDSKKPQFFGEGSVLRQVNIETGEYKIGIHTGQLIKGRVYAGGSCEEFSQLVGCGGKSVLYIGDYIFGDILKSKKTSGWRTFLVIPELGHDLTVWSKSSCLFTKLQDLDMSLCDVYKNMDSGSTNKPDITKIHNSIRNLVQQMDMSYGVLGNPFRSGSSQTTFGDQILRYADLYSSSFTNLIHYPLSYVFSGTPRLMPHEAGSCSKPTDEPKPTKDLSCGYSAVETNNMKDISRATKCTATKSVPDTNQDNKKVRCLADDTVLDSSENMKKPPALERNGSKLQHSNNCQNRIETETEKRHSQSKIENVVPCQCRKIKHEAHNSVDNDNSNDKRNK